MKHLRILVLMLLIAFHVSGATNMLNWLPKVIQMTNTDYLVLDRFVSGTNYVTRTIAGSNIIASVNAMVSLDGSKITSGTVDDARIPAGILRDAEAALLYQPLDTELTAWSLIDPTAKADIASPTFTGDPKVPYIVLTDSDTTAANTAFVKSNITATAAGLQTGSANLTNWSAISTATKADIAGPVFTGDPQVPYVVLTDSDTTVANTAFVKSNITATASGFQFGSSVLTNLTTAGDANLTNWAKIGTNSMANLSGPAFTGNPTAPNQALTDSDTSIANTAFALSNAVAQAALRQVASSVLTNLTTAGDANLTNWAKIGTNSMANLSDPAFTGNPTAPNQALTDSDTSIANTAFALSNAVAQAALRQVASSVLTNLTTAGDANLTNWAKLSTNVVGTGTVSSNWAALTVNDDPYDSGGWNGSTNVPTKNALRDKIESISAGATVLANGSSVSSPNFTNSATINFSVDASTNIRASVIDANLTNWAKLATNTFGTGDFKKDGSVAMTGDMNLGGKSITNVLGITLTLGGTNDQIGLTISTNVWVDTIYNTAGSGAPNFPAGATVPNLALTDSDTSVANTAFALSNAVAQAALRQLGSSVLTNLTAAGDANLTNWAKIASNAMANLAGPVFTGDPQAPYVVLTDSDTTVANTAFALSNAVAQAALRQLGSSVLTNITTAGDANLTNWAKITTNQLVGASVTYASVTNALALTGATTTFLRSDGTQTTPAGSAALTNYVSALNVVLSYGADPTGVADSTAAIQAAITASSNLTYRPTVFVPAGTYTISGTIVLGGGMKLVGESAPLNSTGTKFTKTGTGPCISLTTGGSVLIRGITIYGSGAGSNQQGIQIVRNNTLEANYWKMENVWLYGFNRGLDLGWTWDAELVSCYFSSCGDGITVSNDVNTVTIVGGGFNSNTNGIRFAGVAGSGVSSGWRIQSTFEANQYGIIATNTSVVGNNLFGSYFELHTKAAVYLNASKSWNITGCLFDNPGITNIWANPAYTLNVVGNSFLGDTAYPLYTDATTSFLTYTGNRHDYATQTPFINTTSYFRHNDTNFQASGFIGEAGGLTSEAAATNSTQLVNFAQLQSLIPAGRVNYFTPSAASAFTMGTITNRSTNWMGIVAPAQWTNTISAVTNTSYISTFISTNTFTRFASGSAIVEVYMGENSAGSATFTAEAYLFDAATKTEVYEFTPAPVAQTITGTTPTKFTFSIPIIDYGSEGGTNFYFVVKLKSTDADSTQFLVYGGGAIASHVAFPIPGGSYVLKSGDTMTGALVLAGDSTTPNVVLTDSDTTVANTAFVKSNITALSSTYVPIAGGTMTGNLYISNAAPQLITQMPTVGDGVVAGVVTFQSTDDGGVNFKKFGQIGVEKKEDSATVPIGVMTFGVLQSGVLPTDLLRIGSNGVEALTIFSAHNVSVTNKAYAAAWNGSTNVPTRDDVYDQMELKATLAAPTFTGDATVPYVVLTDSDLTIANTAFVKSNITAASAILQTGSAALSNITANTFKVVDYISIPASSFWPAATNAAIAVTNQVTGASPLTKLNYRFVDATTNRVQIEFPMPPTWDMSTIKYRLNLSHTNAAAGTNVFGVRAKASSTGAWGTAVTMTNVMPNVAFTNVLSFASGAVTVGGTITASKSLAIEVYRDASDAKDDMPWGADLDGVLIEYTKTNTTSSLW